MYLRNSCKKKKWNDEFKGRRFFSHGTTNSCVVAIGYLGAQYFLSKDRKTNKNGCIYILMLQ